MFHRLSAFIYDGTGQLIQDNLDRTAMDRTARASQQGKDNRDSLAGKVGRIMSAWTRQRKEDDKNMTARNSA
jgi:hypothetical protein